MNFVNNITTAFGMTTMVLGAYLLLEKPTFSSTDYLIVTITGMFMIWFKGDSAKSVIEHILGSKFNLPQQNTPPNEQQN